MTDLRKLVEELIQRAKNVQHAYTYASTKNPKEAERKLDEKRKEILSSIEGSERPDGPGKYMLTIPVEVNGSDIWETVEYCPDENVTLMRAETREVKGRWTRIKP